MQTEERKQFQLNTQVIVMLAAVFLALALPLAAVIGFAVGTFKVRQAAAPEALPAEAGAALQRSLEEVAQKNLAPQSLHDAAVEVVVEDIPKKREDLMKLASSFGGSALVMADDKIWAQIPENRVDSFKKACVSTESTTPPPEGGSASLVLVEITLKPKTP